MAKKIAKPDMVIRCAYVERVALDKLKPHPENPNYHPPEQIEQLAKIMRYQGIRNPIVVSKRSGLITRGHGRLEAAKLNGWTEFPVDRQSYENEAQEIADLIADNTIAELAELKLDQVDKLALKLPRDFDLGMLAIPDYKLPLLPGGAGAESSPAEGSKEIGSELFDQLNMKCPRCGFEFEEKKEG